MYMPSAVEYGKGGEKERKNKGNERREIDGNTTETQDEVETTKENDQAGTKMGAERSKRRKDKSEDEMRGVDNDNIESEEMHEGKEIKEKKKRKERNASRKMESENDGKEKKTYQMGDQAICLLRLGQEDHNE